MFSTSKGFSLNEDRMRVTSVERSKADRSRRKVSTSTGAAGGEEAADAAAAAYGAAPAAEADELGALEAAAVAALEPAADDAAMDMAEGSEQRGNRPCRLALTSAPP